VIQALAAAVRLGGAPVSPDRETARRWALDELAGREYAQARPGLAAQLLEWLWRQLSEALSRVPGNGSPLVAALAGIAVLGAILLIVRLVTGSVRRTSARRGGGDVFGGSVRSAGEHRSLAQSAAKAGDWRVAIQEMFRATARSMEERTILDTRPGRTAFEVAREAGVELPDAAAPLREAAEAFDDVTYGERPGTRERYDAVVATDDLVTRSRPRLLTPTPTPT